MSSVFIPFWDIAAARLMAVVVLPTPPFWFVMEMITGVQYSRQLSAPGSNSVGWRAGGDPSGRRSHPILAESPPGDVLEPPLQALGIGVSIGAEGLRFLEHLLLHEDLRLAAQGERDRIARAAVHRPRRAGAREVDAGEKRVVLEVIDHDAVHPGVELLDEVVQQVVSHGARGP